MPETQLLSGGLRPALSRSSTETGSKSNAARIGGAALRPSKANSERQLPRKKRDRAQHVVFLMLKDVAVPHVFVSVDAVRTL
jgi:hypothetical protein